MYEFILTHKLKDEEEKVEIILLDREYHMILIWCSHSQVSVTIDNFCRIVHTCNA